jgi:hypothetical protein
MHGPLRGHGATTELTLAGGTEGSNPSPSAGESFTATSEVNLADASVTRQRPQFGPRVEIMPACLGECPAGLCVFVVAGLIAGYEAFVGNGCAIGGLEYPSEFSRIVITDDVFIVD